LGSLAPALTFTLKIASLLTASRQGEEKMGVISENSGHKFIEAMDFSIFEEFNDEVVVIDKNYRIVYANRKYIEDVGCKNPSEVVGHFCYKVSHHQDEPCEDTCHPCPLREIEKTGNSLLSWV
jgi:transcriptional regulator with PAS, ATPase and Fis domain